MFLYFNTILYYNSVTKYFVTHINALPNATDPYHDDVMYEDVSKLVQMIASFFIAKNRIWIGFLDGRCRV